MNDILTDKELIELEQRGLVADVYYICQKVKSKYMKKYPNLTYKELLKLKAYTNEIDDLYDKRTQKLRGLKILNMMEE